MSGEVEAMTAPHRRQSYRYRIRNLTYITFDSSNGGILRDISESGVAVQALTPLQPGQTLSFALDFANPRHRVEGNGRIAWTDASGQAGIEFIDLSPRNRRSVKEWIFAQLLASARRTAGAEASELLFSSAVRPSIRLDPGPARVIAGGKRTERRLRLFWFTVPAAKFSRVVDGLALLCAVLLFNLLTLSLTDTLPTWPIGLAVVTGATLLFAGLYWLLFSVWFGITPGNRLAELASPGRSYRKEERSRFR